MPTEINKTFIAGKASSIPLKPLIKQGVLKEDPPFNPTTNTYAHALLKENRL